MYGLRLLSSPRVQRDGLFLIVGVVLLFRFAQFMALALSPRWGFDFSAYWAAAGHLLHGEPIYAPGQLSGSYPPGPQFLFLYPPIVAVLFAPFAALFPNDFRVAAGLWAVLGLVILTWSILAITRAEGLDRRFEVLRGRGRWLLVAGAFALTPTIGELAVGNVHIELVGLFSIAWLGLRRGDAVGERWAGLAVAVATLLKVFPVILVLWFIVTRRWTATAWFVAGAAIAVGVAVVFTGLGPWLDYPRVLLNLSAPTDTGDAVAPMVWLTPVLGFGLARALVVGLLVAIVLWSARTQQPILSFSVAVTASIFLAPAVYHHYLTILVLPFLLGLSAGVSLVVLAAAYFLTWIGQQDALGAWSFLLSRAPQTIAVLVLLGGLLSLGRRATPEVSVAGPGATPPGIAPPGTAPASPAPRS